MAQGNILQGQGAGKLGDTVLMVRNGVQVARIYTKAGARTGSAASEASRIQRVRFGAASNQWSLYRYVCTRMYRKGKSGNLSDYNYFVKRNQSFLPYLTKAQNSSGVHCLMPGQLSEGNLGRIEIVTSIASAPSTGLKSIFVADTQHSSTAVVAWSAQMAALKSALKALYPNASKVTYLISAATQSIIDEEGSEYSSQVIVHSPVTIDLYKESQGGEDQQTVKAYFSARISDAGIVAMIGETTKNIIGAGSIFYITATTADDNDAIEKMAVTVFATDDNASDCYTTTVPSDGFPPSQGAYALYSSYRTQEALRVACESYGYQSGVMRDDIAKFGNSLQQQQQAYAARLRSLGLNVESAEE